MIDLEKMFTAEEFTEWEDTIVQWEAEGLEADPEEWRDQLEEAFGDELSGKQLDTETVEHWRGKLGPEIRKARKTFLKKQELEKAAQERFIELRTAGRSYESIAGELSVPKERLLEWQAALSLELGQARYLRLEGMAETSGARREARVETLGGILQRLQSELEPVRVALPRPSGQNYGFDTKWCEID